ncbi:hypothetical protein ACFUMH_14295 [Cellulomonas sp. NPDC057328]|uniref:hypothetical protein n=1 Tax=Cellulomonas sp. NPDC057328 TaxID=3346101 RepID=UPI00362CE733
MSVRRKIAAGVLVASLGSGIGITAALPATAAPAPAAVAVSSVTTSGTTAPVPLPARSVVGLTPGSGITAPGGTAATPNVPIWIRVAVQAALQVIKSRSITTYRQIIAYVERGRTAFVSWWNTSVPTWVKGLLGGISGNAIYDAIKWILGL